MTNASERLGAIGFSQLEQSDYASNNFYEKVHSIAEIRRKQLQSRAHAILQSSSSIAKHASSSAQKYLQDLLEPKAIKEKRERQALEEALERQFEKETTAKKQEIRSQIEDIEVKRKRRHDIQHRIADLQQKAKRSKPHLETIQQHNKSMRRFPVFLRFVIDFCHRRAFQKQSNNQREDSSRVH